MATLRHETEGLGQATGRQLPHGVAGGEHEDIVQDFVAIVTSFCARLYGQRRSKRNTECLIEELESSHAEARDA
jgi:predicted site-specific integrase-resolvase